jgi:GTP cyclohydrolase I
MAQTITSTPELAPEACAGVDRGGPDTTELIRRLLTNIGEDPDREGLIDTPGRVDRSLRFLTSGYGVSPAEVANGALFEAAGAETVIVRDIEFYSMCEHHLLPFFGRVHIAYLPGDKVLGLSKFARIVDVFARRLQLQERFTAQVADALVEVLGPRGVAVVTSATHLCMAMRGVERQGSTTVSSATRDVLAEDGAQRDAVLRSLGL